MRDDQRGAESPKRRGIRLARGGGGESAGRRGDGAEKVTITLSADTARRLRVHAAYLRVPRGVVVEKVLGAWLREKGKGLAGNARTDEAPPPEEVEAA